MKNDGFWPLFHVTPPSRKNATSTGSGLNKDNVADEINLLGMSYFFGGGIEYNIGGNTSLLAGLFFNNGFVDVLSNNDHKAVLNYLTFRVGVLF